MHLKLDSRENLYNFSWIDLFNWIFVAIRSFDSERISKIDTFWIRNVLYLSSLFFFYHFDSALRNFIFVAKSLKVNDKFSNMERLAFSYKL